MFWYNILALTWMFYGMSISCLDFQNTFLVQSFFHQSTSKAATYLNAGTTFFVLPVWRRLSEASRWNYQIAFRWNYQIAFRWNYQIIFIAQRNTLGGVYVEKRPPHHQNKKIMTNEA